MNIFSVLLRYSLMLGMILCLTLASRPVQAEFDPELLSKSAVRVVVKNKKGVAATASGFLWENPGQIVTSLHVMSESPGTKIIVEYGKKKRKATIKAVLPKADLILLEVKRPVEGFVALTSYNRKKPKYKSEVSALGFNRGALGLSTRELRKGYVKPEKLEVLLPPDVLARLKDSDVLDIKLPIYYLDGSLLPGFSGSPVVNAAGELIGVGDGGLESGAASVSWVIPAKNLKKLMASTITELPASLRALGNSFSGEVKQANLYYPQPLFRDALFHNQPSQLANLLAELYQHRRMASVVGLFEQSNNVNSFIDNSGLSPSWSIMLNSNPTAIIARLLHSSVKKAPLSFTNLSFIESATFEQQDLSDEDTMGNLEPFVSVPYNQFEFVKVKTRSYRQLLSTSGTPVEMNKVFRLYQTFFNDYKVDYRQFEFSIYEDDRYGLNIAIPAQAQLTVDENNFLLVKGDMFCRTCPYEIQYHARELNPQEITQVATNPNQFLNKVANSHWVDLNEEGDYGEYSDFRQIESFGSDRYVLRAAYNNFEQPFKSDFELNYFTAATNRNAWFQAQGILNRFDNQFFAALDKHRGTDCRYVGDDPILKPLCNDIRTMLKVMISVHLTSFSNKFYAAQAKIPKQEIAE